MVQKREAKAINKLCVREILSLSFVCGAYFFQFRGRNLVCFVIAYNFNFNIRRKQGRHACALRFSRVSHTGSYIQGKLKDNLTKFSFLTRALIARVFVNTLGSHLRRECLFVSCGLSIKS